MNKQDYLTIAAILHCAADYYLWDGKSLAAGTSQYSCNAIYYALDEFTNCDYYTVEHFLVNEMKFEKHTEYFIKMEEIIDQETIQNLRYDWLKFAAMYAEEKAADFPPSFADVLRLAADKYLTATQEDDDNDRDKEHEISPYTCDAVGYAWGELTNQKGKCVYTPDLMKFLCSLGLITGFDAFRELDRPGEDEVDISYINEAKQGCRFLWLNFAAEYAESEGY